MAHSVTFTPKLYPLHTRIFYLIAVVLFAVGLSAQSTDQYEPYHFSWKRDLSYMGIGGVAVGAGTYFQNRVPKLTRADLRLNDFGRVNIFDQGIGNNLERNRARLTSDKLLNFNAALPAFLVLGKETRQDIHKIALLYVETMAIAGGITNLTKATILRTRPYVLAPDFDDNRVLESGDRASFISGHTSMSAAGAFLFARVFSDYYPESKLKPYVWVAAITLPAATGYLRVRAAKHFPTDIIAGYAVGSAIGYLVPTLHKRAVLPKGVRVTGGVGGVYLGYTF